jgi:predicted transcriptional regulator of viral defense system
MNLSSKIKKLVACKSECELFGINHLVKNENDYQAVAKILSRLVSDNVIHRLKDKAGVYYRPRMSKYGAIKPSMNDVLKFLLFDGSKQVAYVSGHNIYNSYGFSTQMPNVVTIASSVNKRSGVIGGVHVKYIKAYSNIKKNNVKLLQVLDIANGLQDIMDADIRSSYNRLLNIILELNDNDKKQLIKLGENYPPRVKSLIHTILYGVNGLQNELSRIKVPNSYKPKYQWKKIENEFTRA